MTIRSSLLRLAAALVVAAPVAQAASVKQLFEQYNLLGTWAYDCGTPASGSNLYYLNRVLPNGGVQRDEMIGPEQRRSVAIIETAKAAGPNEITLGGTRDSKPTDATWRIESHRMRATEVTIDGQKVISSGRNVASGTEVPWANKCSQ